jgi:hypothetical protein
MRRFLTKVGIAAIEAQTNGCVVDYDEMRDQKNVQARSFI